MKFSIVIPAYNEEKAIENTLKELKDYLSNKKYQTEIIVVNDGQPGKKLLTHISDTTILLFVLSLFLFFFGLLADQISAIRREIR